MPGRSIQRARKLRKTMSPPELALWFQLRALRAEGWHFRRQAPEGPYILDFVCRREKLVIEVDGIQHSSPEQANHDKVRDAFLTARGFRIIRIAATEIGHELDGVMLEVRAALGPPSATLPQSQAGASRSSRYTQLTCLGLRLRGET
jgi:very-short-patch-repair endonuclease